MQPANTSKLSQDVSKIGVGTGSQNNPELLPDQEERFEWQSATRSQIEREILRGVEERDTKKHQATLTFEEVMRLNMGSFMTPRNWLKNCRDSERLHQQTEDLADALEAEGVAARRESGIVRIDDVTHQVTELPSYRNICFLPAVAKRNRRDQVDDLEYFLSKVDSGRGAYWRYITITFGQRIPAGGDLGGAITKANIKMARWRERVLKDLGVVVGFTGLEFPRDEEDESYHLHANVLVRTPYFFDGGEAFRTETQAHFGTWWKDNGQIGNVAELVKYPFKPNSLKGADSSELKWLFDQTFGRRIIRLMGPVSEFRKERKESGKRVFRVKGDLRLRYVCRISAEENGLSEDGGDEGGGAGENIIVGREAPSFRNSMWATSGTLVYNYNPAPPEHRQGSRRRLETMLGYMADAKADYAASGAPDADIARQFRDALLSNEDESGLRALWNKAGGSYIVHNDTISSQDNESEGGAEVVELFPEPDPPPKQAKFLEPKSENGETKGFLSGLDGKHFVF